LAEKKLDLPSTAAEMVIELTLEIYGVRLHALEIH
jgi:hypothetical protein